MADDLKAACLELMKVVSVGEGKVVCPPALEPSVRAIYEALKTAPRRRGVHLHKPQREALDLACRQVVEAFGLSVYLVGSCLERPDYRDVDVRCMLAPEEFARMFPDADPAFPYRDPRWRLLCMALSDYLRKCSGLPVDFQFQDTDKANEEFRKPRHALGLKVKG